MYGALIVSVSAYSSGMNEVHLDFGPSCVPILGINPTPPSWTPWKVPSRAPWVFVSERVDETTRRAFSAQFSLAIGIMDLWQGNLSTEPNKRTKLQQKVVSSTLHKQASLQGRPEFPLCPREVPINHAATCWRRPGNFSPQKAQIVPLLSLPRSDVQALGTWLAPMNRNYAVAGDPGVL